MPAWAWVLAIIGILDVLGLVVFAFCVIGSQPFPYDPEDF